MNQKQRAKAVIDLTNAFLNTYFENWRLSKVLALSKILRLRYEFFDEFREEVKEFNDEDGCATIAQEIKHGLYFDAISQCVQYIEDLFALIKATQTPDFFIRNIISYKAGEVANYIKSYKVSPKKLSESYHYPIEVNFQNSNTQSVFNLGGDCLMNMTIDLIRFYIDHEFIYNQYKHGLTVAMRPFGNKFTKEQIEKDKMDLSRPYLAIYDNINLQHAVKRPGFNTEGPILFPLITKNVQPFLQDLIDENNYSRFVLAPDNTTKSVVGLIECARKARCCIHTLIVNYSRKIGPDKLNRQFKLPTDFVRNLYTVFSSDNIKE